LSFGACWFRQSRPSSASGPGGRSIEMALLRAELLMYACCSGPADSAGAAHNRLPAARSADRLDAGRPYIPRDTRQAGIKCRVVGAGALTATRAASGAAESGDSGSTSTLTGDCARHHGGVAGRLVTCGRPHGYSVESEPRSSPCMVLATISALRPRRTYRRNRPAAVPFAAYLWP
jgi:hypothetical protein